MILSSNLGLQQQAPVHEAIDKLLMTTGSKTGKIRNKRMCRQSRDLAVGFLLNHHFLVKKGKSPNKAQLAFLPECMHGKE